MGQAHQRKVSQIGEACSAEGINFVPLAVEVLGGWSDVAVKQLQRLGKAQAGRSVREEGEVVCQLFKTEYPPGQRQRSTAPQPSATSVINFKI